MPGKTFLSVVVVVAASLLDAGLSGSRHRRRSLGAVLVVLVFRSRSSSRAVAAV